MQARVEIQKLLQETVNQLTGNPSDGGEIKLEHPAEDVHGDYSSNIALVAGGGMELAEKIAESLRKLEDLRECVEKIEVAKPGFINFWLSRKALCDELSRALVENYGTSDVGKGKTLLLDHSHPNIAKRFGIGHLRSTIIGQAIINLYRFIGWSVIADNFLGDWGTQFGMIIAQIKRKNLNVSDLSIDDIEKLYVEFNQELKEDESLQDLARNWFKKLEDGDEDARMIWAQVKKVSMKEFEKIWELLGVKFDYIHAESFFEDKMLGVIADAKEKGIAVESQGALVVHIPESETPLLLLKSDGATTYETRDLAAIKFWKEEFNPDIIAYEVGSEQGLHFQHVFKVAEMLGYISCEKLIHIQHGLYLGSDGKKMRTRTGDTIKLGEVLNEAVARAAKLASKGDAFQSWELAKAVGIGAVKYFDLAHHHASDIIFDWEKMFVLEGNSAPYLQYTYARCQSILQKTTDYRLPTTAVDCRQWTVDLQPEEVAMLRHIYKFPEVIEDAALNFTPNTVCTYLFELAQRYNTFYAKHRVLEGNRQQAVGNRKTSAKSLVPSASQAFRLALTQATSHILKTGLHLLGIEAPSKM